MDSTDKTYIRVEYDWAIAIVTRYFNLGLTELFDPESVKDRVDWFHRREDPLYSVLLRSSGKDIYNTFVGYWTLAQTLATQSRFWLEWAICDVVRDHRARLGREVQVYSLRDLATGGLTVAFMGEREKEWLGGIKPFRVGLKQNALDFIDREVGRVERVLSVRHGGPETLEGTDAELERWDEEMLSGMPRQIKGRETDRVSIQCNLLVVEPGEGQVNAIRYVNDKSLSPAQAHREKVNILRVYAWLCQEKVLRRSVQLHARIADLLPRYHTYPADRGPSLFSRRTYWSHDLLWDFIGVPYDVVTLAMEDVGKGLREHLSKGMASILPGASDPPQLPLFR